MNNKLEKMNKAISTIEEKNSKLSQTKENPTSVVYPQEVET